MMDDPSRISKTLATDAAIPWCKPRIELINGRKMEVVGLSLPPRCAWLHKLLRNPKLAFELDANDLQCRALLESSFDLRKSVSLSLDSNTTVQLAFSTVGEPGPPEPIEPEETLLSPPRLFVPAQLLAYLDEYRAGSVLFDTQTGRFTSAIADPTYEDAILFARTIDDVPQIVSNALVLGFPFDAENARIEEIKKQSDSLHKLVFVVGALVFLFGILTVFGVLWESTARKRSVIGIMRVMGVTPLGAFLIVVIRAIILGAVAGVVTVCAGWICVIALTWDPINARFEVLDLNHDHRLSGEELVAEQVSISSIDDPIVGLDMNRDGQLNLREYRDVDSPWKYKVVVSAVLERKDLYLVVAGSILCCMVGSVVPALSAARLDPFDALVQGRFR